jgi:insulysin
MLKFIICVLISLPLYAIELTTVNKHTNDKRNYQALVLSNGLKVLLISDSTLEKSAAALDVQVGFFADSAERLGLSHFLEHMLFLGTSKYPDSDSYLDFITKHGGQRNAWTSLENTEYLLSIAPDNFDEALDRFSQFFIAPLFNQELVERERNAVESEYKLKLKDEGARYMAAFAATSNPKHPFHRFKAGNLETLNDNNSKKPPVRQALIEFYNTHYSADKMTLVLAGPQKLNKLQALAIKYFSSVPKRNTTATELVHQALEQEFAQDLSIKSLGDQRELALCFKLENKPNNYQKKSLEFIKYLLQQTGKGSLKEHLWNNNWITKYNIASDELTSQQDLLQISFELTTLGAKNIEEITNATLQYIQYLQESAVDEKYFNDLKNARMRDAGFREGQDEFALVGNYGKWMHAVPLQDIVVHDDFTATTQFDAQNIHEIFAKLTPQNMRRIYLHKDISTKFVEQWYKVAYDIVPYSPKQIAQWSQPAKCEFINNLENNLLATNFKINEVSGNINTPGLVLQNSSLSLWHKQDNRLKQPKVSLRLLLRGTKLEASPASSLKLSFITKAVINKLEQYESIFDLAGIKCNIHNDHQGLIINLDMFSDKVAPTLEIIAKAIVQVELTPEHFDGIKDELKRALLNQQFKAPFKQALTQLMQVIFNTWSTEAKLANIDNITMEMVKEYWLNFVANTKISALIIGNITDIQAIAAAKHFQAKINPNIVGAKLIYDEMLPLVVYQPNERYGLEFDAKHPDSALISYFQLSELGDIAVAKALLLHAIVDAALFEQLRTQEQLGYVVFLQPYIVKNRAGLLCGIQSPVASPVVLNKRLTEFFKNYQTKVDDMSNEQLNKYKSSLKRKLLEKPKSIAEDAQMCWAKILDASYDFNFYNNVANKVDNIKLQDLRNYYKSILVNNQKAANIAVYTQIDQANLAADFIQLKNKSMDEK